MLPFVITASLAKTSRLDMGIIGPKNMKETMPASRKRGGKTEVKLKLRYGGRKGTRNITEAKVVKTT